MNENSFQYEQKQSKKQYIQSSDEEQSLHEPDKPPSSNKNSSSSSLKYSQLISQSMLNCRSKQQLIAKLKNHKINYNFEYSPTVSNSSLKLTSLAHTRHYQVIDCDVTLGPFTSKIRIFNLFEQNSLIYQCPVVYFSRVNSVNAFQYNGKKYITKCIYFSEKISPFSKRKELISVMKEYFITKIMSILQIGPYIPDQFGFDLFVSEKDVFFILEFCQNPKMIEFKSQDQLDLKSSLKQMHSLNILHRDIKTDNIMYSSNFAKFVFIDFGISQYRKQKLGQLIFTSFAGTYAFSTDQMKILFNNKQKQWVNLYLNDANGLSMSIKEIKTSIQSEYLILKESQSKQTAPQVTDWLFFLQIKIKFSLLNKNYMNQNQFIFGKLQQLKQVDLCYKIMTFLYEIPLNQKMRIFYHENLYEISRKQKLFQDLHEIFQTPIYYQSYKGKRKFVSEFQKQKYQSVKNFYEGLKLEIPQFREKKKRIDILFMQQIVLNTQNFNSIKSLEYRTTLVQYLNFKRIDTSISIDKKILACQNYLKLKQVAKQKNYYNLKIEEIISLTFHTILFQILKDVDTNQFDLLITVLENYFIVSRAIDLNVLSKIQDLIQIISSDTTKDSIKKTLMILKISLTRLFTCRKYISTSVYQNFIRIEKIVAEKISAYSKELKQNQLPGFKLFYILNISQDALSIEQNLFYEDQAHYIIENIQSLRQDYPQFSIVLNLIQYKAIMVLQKILNFFHKRKQIEALIYERILNEKELNVAIFEIMKAYGFAKQIKTIKQLFSLLDQTIQIPNVSLRYFSSLRIYLQLMETRPNLQKQKIQFGVKRIILANQQYLREDRQCLISLIKEKMAIFVVQHEFQIHKSNIYIPNELKKYTQKLSFVLQKAIKQYQKSPYQIPKYRGSKNLLYLQLIFEQIQIQYMIIRPKKRKDDSQQTWDLFSKTAYFQKIVSIDRSSFTQKDEIYVLLFDLIKLNQSKKPRLLLQKLKSLQKIIKTAFLKQSIQFKTYLLSSLTYSFYHIIHFNDSVLLNEAIQFIYPIIAKRFVIPSLGASYARQILKALVKIEKYEWLLDQVILVSQYSNTSISTRSITSLTIFFNLVIGYFEYYWLEKQFYQFLRQILPKIDLKKIPFFTIFLLSCMKPFNRKKVLKIIVKNLKQVKFSAKYIILSRLYKQMLKLPNLSKRKRKYICRKDAYYPSAYTLNIKEIKQKLDCINCLESFQVIYKDAIDKKIHKIGECCQIYSQFKQKHYMNKILSHICLDSTTNDNRMEPYEFQEW